MPKTNLCKPREDPREAAVRAMIAGEAARLGIRQCDVAKKAGIAESTLSKRMKNPRNMRLGELWDCIRILNPDETVKQKLI